MLNSLLGLNSIFHICANCSCNFEHISFRYNQYSLFVRQSYLFRYITYVESSILFLNTGNLNSHPHFCQFAQFKTKSFLKSESLWILKLSSTKHKLTIAIIDHCNLKNIKIMLPIRKHYFYIFKAVPSIATYIFLNNRPLPQYSRNVKV